MHGLHRNQNQQAWLSLKNQQPQEPKATFKIQNKLDKKLTMTNQLYTKQVKLVDFTKHQIACKILN